MAACWSAVSSSQYLGKLLVIVRSGEKRGLGARRGGRRYSLGRRIAHLLGGFAFGFSTGCRQLVRQGRFGRNPGVASQFAVAGLPARTTTCQRIRLQKFLQGGVAVQDRFGRVRIGSRPGGGQCRADGRRITDAARAGQIACPHRRRRCTFAASAHAAAGGKQLGSIHQSSRF